MKVSDCMQKDFLLCAKPWQADEIRLQAENSGCRYILLMSGDQVKAVVSVWKLLVVSSCLTGNGDDFPAALTQFCQFREDDPISLLAESKHDLAVVVDAGGKPIGVLDQVQLLAAVWRQGSTASEQLVNEYHEFKDIIQHIEEEIFLVDGDGHVLFLNPAAEKVCGFKKEDVIGRHVTDLERENLISSSISMIVFKTREKVNIMQRLITGKTVLGTAVPVFDQQGEISRVICTSKNVTEINNLMQRIDKQDRELAKKEEQLDIMRQALFSQNNFTCQSRGMEAIRETVVKIAPTDLTVLIQGESGVGKEVAARLVHNLSPRSKFAFVKINCGLIPENLIESELFGYESGAFTGANKNGKIGKIELADQGTLFLDEIGEMPLLLQVKLLEFLQDREITRVGGTRRIRVNTRIVAATNRDLKEMVQRGTFREDLYYRLNVFPLQIAPLRQRPEDAVTFADYFLRKFNDKYGYQKTLAPDVLERISNYSWPGNVRELEHVMERAVVSSNSHLITAADIDISADLNQERIGKVICTGLLPWKEAKRSLEEQLFSRAYDVYKSTYKAAKALDVCQSTVVKVLKNINE